MFCKDVPLAYCHHYGHDVLDNWSGPWHYKCDKILGIKGGLQFVSMKWKARADDTNKPPSEPELDPHTSDIDTNKTPDENKDSTYNLRPW